VQKGGYIELIKNENLKLITLIKNETVEENSSNFGHDIIKILKETKNVDFTNETHNIMLEKEKEVLQFHAIFNVTGNDFIDDDFIDKSYNQSYNQNHNQSYNQNQSRNYSQSNNQMGGMTNIIDINDDEYLDTTGDELKQYFVLKKICRYYSEENKTFNYDANEPTLSLSLFMRPFCEENPPKGWANKYVVQQLRAISLFKYFFPKGYVRVYIDKFLVEILKSDKLKIDIGDDFSKSNEYSEVCKKNVQIHLQKIYESFSSLELKQYSNTFQKIVELYDIVSRSYFENDKNDVNYSLKNENGITLFVYEFKNIYSTKYDVTVKKVGENSNDGVSMIPVFGTIIKENNETGKIDGHIMQGSIGQLIRYISMAQKPYLHNGENIISPKILLFRDGHSNPMGQYDYEWTKGIIKLAQSEKKNIILMPSCATYSQPWHDIIDNAGNPLAPIAGQVTSCNFSENISHLNNNEFYKSVGSLFLLNPNKMSPVVLFLKKISHTSYVNGYGIDEFLLSPFYQIKSIVNRSIYRNFTFLNNFINIAYYDVITSLKKTFNKEIIAYVVLTHYLIKVRELKKNETDIFKIINAIESLRNYESLKKNKKFEKYAREIMKEYNIDVAIKKFGLYLGLFPNKYHIVPTLFNQNNLHGMENAIPEKCIDIFYAKISSDFRTSKRFDNDKFNSFIRYILNNPENFNIMCSDLIFMSPVDVHMMKYLTKTQTKTTKKLCDKNYYISGFYDIAIQDVPLPILRNPQDLKYVYHKYMENGKIDTATLDEVSKLDKLYKFDLNKVRQTLQF
jgi:hypothetical protein